MTAKTEWIIVPNDYSNERIAKFLGQDVEESVYEFVYDRKPKKGYLIPMGYTLVTTLRDLASSNPDVKYETYKKVGNRITLFSFDSLRKRKMKRRINKALSQKGIPKI